MLVKISGKRNEEILTTTSRKVAEVFGKEHSHVLRDIRELGCSDDFRKSNFGFSEYKVDGNNKTYKECVITRDGFTLLVMGYTGEKGNAIQGGVYSRFQRNGKRVETSLCRTAAMGD